MGVKNNKKISGDGVSGWVGGGGGCWSKLIF